MKKDRPILVFDSGFGGLSVLKQLVKQLPGEKFLYFGDSANAPYGPRRPEEIAELTLAAIRRFDAEDPKAVVIACNTATAYTLPQLKEAYPDKPVFGIRPAVKPAEEAGMREILAMATAGTIASPAYKAQLETVDPAARVTSVPAPGIVLYVEGLKKGREEIVAYLEDQLAPYADRHFDAVVLGCTHFPFAKEEIAEALGYPVRFFDAGIRLAETVAETLREQGLARQGARTRIRFLNSSDRPGLEQFAKKLMALED